MDAGSDIWGQSKNTQQQITTTYQTDCIFTLTPNILMLKHLSIINLAVIENIELSFSEGLTVLTGETGAGKSILIGALGLVLGDRADTSVIRTGCARTEISAAFNVAEDERLLQLLEEQSISVVDNELVLRRIINRDGRSRAYINTTAVPLQLLRDAGAFLIDIHGQHAHQGLLKRDVQRELLDGFGDHGAISDQVSRAFEKWDGVTREISSLTDTAGESGDRLSLLKYQVEELQALELEENEADRLEDEYKRLANLNNLLETAQTALDGLHAGEQSVADRINTVKKELTALERFDPGLANISGLLENAAIHISEAAAELGAYLHSLDQDPARLNQVEQRLEQLHDMARKHRVQPQLLFAHFQSITRKLDAIEQNRERLAELELEQLKSLEEYRTAADNLGERRRECATVMAADISARIRTLGMPEGTLNINVTPGPDLKPHKNGNNQVEFLVSANPGQALLPLRKVASGGELSRISLAVQVSANRDSSVATMIFDEVDAGIAGGIAEIVGNLLHKLAADRQILCVTHLPQVASQGDNHFRVTKTIDDKITETQVHELGKDERIEEIARMLGGIRVSEQSRNHAREMLGSA